MNESQELKIKNELHRWVKGWFTQDPIENNNEYKYRLSELTEELYSIFTRLMR